jgi:uncharacterized protein (TIGR02996 family)
MSATLTTGDALLRAVLDNPADDSVRLVYADWLEESGQGERAEFIRVQVELALREFTRMAGDGASAWHRETQRLRRRERAIMHGRGRWWSDHGPGDRITVTEWRRGFVAEVACACADWLRHGPRLVRLQPLERVRLKDREPTRYGNQGLMHPPGPRWLWFVAPSSGEMIYPPRHPAEIPRPIWTVYAELYRAEDLGWEHPTEEAAWDALSRACLAWARSQEPS